MEANKIIQELEQEQKELSYNNTFLSNTQKNIDCIKHLFSGYVKLSKELLMLLTFGCIFFYPMFILGMESNIITLIKYNYTVTASIFMSLPFCFILYLVFIINKRKKIDVNYNTLVSKLTNFYRVKSEIQNSYISLLGNIISDIKSSNINTEDVETIKNILEKLTFEYSQLKKINILLNPNMYLISFKKNKQAFIDLMKKISSEEMEYSYDLKIKITEKIKIWTLHHQSELQELEKSIGNQAIQTENADGKFALESQKVRLQSYIESINNLVK